MTAKIKEKSFVCKIHGDLSENQIMHFQLEGKIKSTVCFFCYEDFIISNIGSVEEYVDPSLARQDWCMRRMLNRLQEDDQEAEEYIETVLLEDAKNKKRIESYVEDLKKKGF